MEKLVFNFDPENAHIPLPPRDFWLNGSSSLFSHSDHILSNVWHLLPFPCFLGTQPGPMIAFMEYADANVAKFHSMERLPIFLEICNIKKTYTPPGYVEILSEFISSNECHKENK